MTIIRKADIYGTLLAVGRYAYALRKYYIYRRFLMDIGRNIKTYRSMLGLKQEELAERTKITLQYLSNIETNKKKPSLDVLEEIATALNVSVGLLFLENLEEVPDEDNPTMGSLNNMLVKLLIQLKSGGNNKLAQETNAKGKRIKGDSAVITNKMRKAMPSPVLASRTRAAAASSNNVKVKAKAKSKHQKAPTVEMSDHKK